MAEEIGIGQKLSRLFPIAKMKDPKERIREQKFTRERKKGKPKQGYSPDGSDEQDETFNSPGEGVSGKILDIEV